MVECCEFIASWQILIFTCILLLNVDRKLLLTGVILFAWPGSIEQIAFGLIVTICCLCLYAKFEPYVDGENSLVQVTSQLSTCFCLVGASLLKAQSLRESQKAALKRGKAPVLVTLTMPSELQQQLLQHQQKHGLVRSVS